MLRCCPFEPVGVVSRCVVVWLYQRNGTSICNSSGSHQHGCFICTQPNQQETHMRFDLFQTKTYLPVAVVVIIAFVSAVEQRTIDVISASMIVAIATGAPNLTIEVAEAKLTVDRNGKQTSKDCDALMQPWRRLLPPPPLPTSTMILGYHPMRHWIQVSQQMAQNPKPAHHHLPTQRCNAHRPPNPSSSASPRPFVRVLPVPAERRPAAL